MNTREKLLIIRYQIFFKNNFNQNNNIMKITQIIIEFNKMIVKIKLLKNYSKSIQKVLELTQQRNLMLISNKPNKLGSLLISNMIFC